jgi:parallel beta-helix repeat protein
MKGIPPQGFPSPPHEASTHMATYYVSSSLGSDSNNGLDPATPWKTMETLFDRSNTRSIFFLPGDRILLRAGDTWCAPLTFRDSGVAGNNILISRYGTGANPIILGNFANVAWEPVAGHTDIYRKYIGNGTVIARVVDGPNLLTRKPTNGIQWWTTSGLTQYLNTFTPGSWGPDRANNYTYVRTTGGAPTPQVVAYAQGCIATNGYCTVENMDLRRSWQGMDFSGANGLIIRKNSVMDTLSIGIYLRIGNHNCLIEDNVTTRTGNDGIYIYKSNNNVIRRNRISHVITEVLGVPVTGDQAGLGLQESENNLVEYNHFSFTTTSAVDYFFEVNSVVRYNFLFHGGGGSFPHGTGLRLHNNIFHLDGAGPGGNSGQTGSVTNLVYNNVYFNTGSYGLIGQANVKFRNNVVVGPSNLVISSTANHENADYDYNLYFDPVGVPRWKYNGANYTTLASYQAASGKDLNSAYGDPGFAIANPVNPEDFMPRENSLMLNSGLNMKAVGLIPASDPYLDYSGISIPRGDGAEKGAYERPVCGE